MHKRYMLPLLQEIFQKQGNNRLNTDFFVEFLYYIYHIHNWMSKTNKLPIFNKLCYGFGTMGYSSLSQTLNSFIMFFGTSIMGISGSLVGIAIAIASLWDGISDPLVGNISDRTKNKFFGKRLGYVLIAIFCVAVCNILLWSMPSKSQGFMFCWLLIFMLLQETVNTFFSTPMSALALDLAPDYNEQSKIQSYKTVFGIIGMILPSILMYFFMPSISIGVQTQYTQSGFISIAYINSVLMVFCGLIGVFGNLKRVQKTQTYSLEIVEKRSLKKLMFGYFEVFKNSSFACIILGYSVSQMASSFLTSIGMHLFTYCYHFSSTQISILLLCMFGGAIISQPIWFKLSKRIDKKLTVITALSVVLMGIGATLITFLFRTYIDISIIFPITCLTILICGFGTGAMYSLPISMYADLVALKTFETGENKSGAYLGYYSFTYNLSNSISLLIMGFLLDLIKFDSTKVVQPMSVQTGLGTIVFCGCSICLALAILIFSKYNVKRADILKTQMKINELKEENKNKKLVEKY